MRSNSCIILFMIVISSLTEIYVFKSCRAFTSSSIFICIPVLVTFVCKNSNLIYWIVKVVWINKYINCSNNMFYSFRFIQSRRSLISKNRLYYINLKTRSNRFLVSYKSMCDLSSYSEELLIIILYVYTKSGNQETIDVPPKHLKQYQSTMSLFRRMFQSVSYF